MVSTKAAATTAVTAATVAIAGKMMFSSFRQSTQVEEELAFLKAHPSVISLLEASLDQLSGDALVKIVRQLQFWMNDEQSALTPEELDALTKRLIHTATWHQRSTFQCPKVRFGRTEIQMPIITAGAMRYQHTWMPDDLPICIRKDQVLKTPSQENILNIVRACLKMGINHFETARMYGTSEIQLVHALNQLIEMGEIQRSHFILQTKCVVRPKDEFIKLFDQSWQNIKSLQYIDLFSFHVVSKTETVDQLLGEEHGLLELARQYQQEGKIRHIGFSTHGSAENIYKLIDSNQFDYVNLHYHYFGSYHAEGTPVQHKDTIEHGNAACVKRALELDMGVFNISPIDKGGHLYQPSATVARAVGHTGTPISFAALYSWQVAKMHTVSIGFARPEDLAEIVEAAEIFLREQNTNVADQDKWVTGPLARLDAIRQEKLGKDWAEQGLIHVPGPFHPETDGIGLGHMLWCHNMLQAYGMYDAASARYNNLVDETKKWKKNKTYQENMTALAGGNPMRSLDDAIDLDAVLAKHYNPQLAKEKLAEVQEWLAKPKNPLTKEERAQRGWDEAYDLRTWHEFPDTARISMSGVILQNITSGWFGAGGGPTKESKDLAIRYREQILKMATATGGAGKTSSGSEVAADKETPRDI